MDIDIDMEHGHGHAVWTWTCSMDMDTQHGFGHAAWIWQWTCMDAGMRNADKQLSLASLVFCQFTTLSPALAFWHHG
jgi:hypothetical protein